MYIKPVRGAHGPRTGTSIAGLAQRPNDVSPSSNLSEIQRPSAPAAEQSVEQMACAILRRALSLTAAGAHATPRVAAAFASASASSSSSVIAPLRSPLDERLLRLLRSEITYLAERRPPYLVIPSLPLPRARFTSRFRSRTLTASSSSCSRRVASSRSPWRTARGSSGCASAPRAPAREPEPRR